MNIVNLKSDIRGSLLAVLANQTSEALVILDEKFNIVLFNSRSEKIFCCLEIHVIGKSFEQVCAESNIKCFISPYKKRLAEPMLTIEMPIVIHAMKNIWHLQRIDVDGHIFYLLKTMDLKEQNNLNEVYQLETLIENMPCNVYWMDNNCRMVGCNQNVLTMLHLNRDQFRGKTYDELSTLCHWPEGLADKLKNDDLTVLKTGNPIFAIEDPPIPHADGTFLHPLTSRVPIRNNEGKIVGVAGISTDITQLKKTEHDLKIAKEDAESSNRAKSDFISNMQHDLRTPFSGIGGMASVLYAMSEEKYPEFSELLKIMINSCEQWQSVHNRIFDVFDVEQIAPINIEPVSISKEVEKIQEMLSATLYLKKLRCILEPVSPELDMIDTDALKFHLILLSLISNAVNFTEQGEVTVAVFGDKNERVIKVMDTGIGIPVDKFEYIFERFTKLSLSNKDGEHFKGVGLGLYIARAYATQLGATIHVNSQLGKGSIFSLQFFIKKT